MKIEIEENKVFKNRNREEKNSSGSLNKYYRSPYLQSTSPYI